VDQTKKRCIGRREGVAKKTRSEGLVFWCKTEGDCRREKKKLLKKKQKRGREEKIEVLMENVE